MGKEEQKENCGSCNHHEEIKGKKTLCYYWSKWVDLRHWCKYWSDYASMPKEMRMSMAQKLKKSNDDSDREKRQNDAAGKRQSKDIIWRVVIGVVFYGLGFLTRLFFG